MPEEYVWQDGKLVKKKLVSNEPQLPSIEEFQWSQEGSLVPLQTVEPSSTNVAIETPTPRQALVKQLGMEPKPFAEQVIEQGFVSPALAVSQGLIGASQHVWHVLTNVAKKVGELDDAWATAVGKPNPKNVPKLTDLIVQEGVSNQSKLAEWSRDIDEEIEKHGGMNKVAKQVYQGIGSFSGELPFFAASLPIYMGLQGASDAVDTGENIVAGLARGVGQGFFYKYAFKMLNKLPRLERVTTSGTLFASPSFIYTLSQKPKDRDWATPVSEFLLGAGLSWPGVPNGAEYRRAAAADIMKMTNRWLRDITFADEIARYKVRKRMVRALQAALDREIMQNPSMAAKDAIERAVMSTELLGETDKAGRPLATIDKSQVAADIKAIATKRAIEEAMGQEPKEWLNDEGNRIIDLDIDPKVAADNLRRIDEALNKKRALQETIDNMGPKGVGSVALEGDTDALAAWIVNHDVGDWEAASTWLNERAKDMTNPHRLAYEQASDFIDAVLRKKPGMDAALETLKWYKKELEETVPESEIPETKTETLVEKARSLFEEVPPIEDVDPITGHKMIIPSKLASTNEWLEQNEKRILRLKAIGEAMQEAIENTDDFFVKVMGAFDVETPFIQEGFPETGFNVKNYYSVIETYQEQGQRLVTRIAKMLDWNDRLLRELPFIFEDKEHPLRDDPKIKQAIELLDETFESMEKLLTERGVIRRGWKERILQEIDYMIKAAETVEEKRELGKLRKKVAKTSYEHIPSISWMLKKVRKGDVSAAKLVRSLLTFRSGKRRESIRLYDLIEKNIVDPMDIHIRDVIGDYFMRVGKDIAMANIYDAALKEGAASLRARKDFESASFLSPIFYGKKVHPILNEWIDRITNYRDRGLIEAAFKGGMSLIKMARFYNPLFLPMYDAYQAGQLSGFKWIKHVPAAIRDWRHGTAEWYEASMNGLRSKPFYMNIDEYYRKVVGASDPIWKRALKVNGKWSPNLLRHIYEASWQTAWTMDGIMRQASYRALRAQGYSVRRAAQEAATYHGDYASVPKQTREFLNMFWFTPTFKIAMLKAHAHMWKEMTKAATGQTPYGNTHAWGIARALMMMMATDMLMSFMGFQREGFGTKYRKKVDTEYGEKEIVINFPGPHSMWHRQLQIAEEARDPLHDFPFKEWVGRELGMKHPFYNSAEDFAENVDRHAEPTPLQRALGVDKVPITYWTDSPKEKAAKTLLWAFREAVPVVNAFIKDEKAEAARKAMAKATSKWFEIMTRPFTFRYLRTPKDVRYLKKIKQLSKEASELLQHHIENGTVVQGQQAIEKRLQELIEAYEAYNDVTWVRRQMRRLPGHK